MLFIILRIFNFYNQNKLNYLSFFEKKISHFFTGGGEIGKARNQNFFYLMHICKGKLLYAKEIFFTLILIIKEKHISKQNEML